MTYSFKKGGHSDLHRIIPMLEFEFRDYERMSELKLQQALITGSAELLLLKDENGVENGFLITYCKSIYGYVLAAYMVVYPTFRGEGASHACLDLLKERYADTQGIFLEVSDYPEMAKAHVLHDYYAREGWRDVDAGYRAGGRPGMMMQLPVQGPAEVPVPVAKRILTEIYSHIVPEEKVGEYISFDQ